MFYNSRTLCTDSGRTDNGQEKDSFYLRLASLSLQELAIPRPRCFPRFEQKSVIPRYLKNHQRYCRKLSLILEKQRDISKSNRDTRVFLRCCLVLEARQ